MEVVFHSFIHLIIYFYEPSVIQYLLTHCCADLSIHSQFEVCSNERHKEHCRPSSIRQLGNEQHFGTYIPPNKSLQDRPSPSIKRSSLLGPASCVIGGECFACSKPSVGRMQFLSEPL